MVVLINTVNPVYASHGDLEDGVWDHDAIDWKCLTTTLDLPMEGTWTPCGEINSIESVWNNISNSDFELDQVSSGQDFTIGAEDFGNSDWGITYRTIGSSPNYYLTNVSIEFNTDLGGDKWGDKAGADWWKWWVKDFKSTAIHEFGHTVRLAHDSGSTLMKSNHNIGDVYRTPSAHDTAEVQDKY